ncbi:MAG: aldehyde dehydrogenase family protein [Slackia sp.]
MQYPVSDSYKLFIGGRWVDASTAPRSIPIARDGERIASIADATRQDVDAAVDAAHEAFVSWGATQKGERARILNAIADVIEENAEHLALVESIDNGKPIRETRAIDVAYSAEHFRYFAGVLLAETGEADMVAPNMMSIVVHEPIGVVGQIVPWNFPLLMAAWKLAPVLAAGDCTVLKPSSSTSLSVLELARLTQDVIPAGVFNVVTGRGSKSGQYLLENTRIAKLAFTGSTEVGREVARAAADRLIPATLELGGKSANIVFPDAKRDMAIDGIQLGILFNQGQVCCAGSRIFVHEDIYDEFVPEVIEAFKKVKVGLPERGHPDGVADRRASGAKDPRLRRIGERKGEAACSWGVVATEGELAKGAFLSRRCEFRATPAA